MKQKWVGVIIAKSKDGKIERESWQTTPKKRFGIFPKKYC